MTLATMGVGSNEMLCMDIEFVTCYKDTEGYIDVDFIEKNPRNSLLDYYKQDELTLYPVPDKFCFCREWRKD